MAWLKRRGYQNHYDFVLIFTLILGMSLVFCPQSGQAVDDYPGFGFSATWSQYTEISIEQNQKQNDVNISQQIAQILFKDPQSFWLSFGLGWEKIDDYPLPQGKEIDDDLCFHIAGAYYIAPNLEFGIPADLSLDVEYSRARHDVAEDKLTHQRFTATVNLEWDYPPATPYIRAGMLHSTIKYTALFCTPFYQVPPTSLTETFDPYSQRFDKLAFGIIGTGQKPSISARLY